MEWPNGSTLLSQANQISCIYNEFVIQHFYLISDSNYEKSNLISSAASTDIAKCKGSNIGIGTMSPQSNLHINGYIALGGADLTISTTYTPALKLNTIKQSYYKFKPATVPNRIYGIRSENIGVSTTARTSIINP